MRYPRELNEHERRIKEIFHNIYRTQIWVSIEELEDMMEAAATGLETGLRTWFQVTVPNLTKSFFVVGQPGTKIPLPAMAQNELLTGSISIAIDEYVGLDTKVAPTEGD